MSLEPISSGTLENLGEFDDRSYPSSRISQSKNKNAWVDTMDFARVVILILKHNFRKKWSSNLKESQ